MPSLKDITKVTAILKVGYDKVYKLMEDDQKISDTIEKAEGMLKKVPGGKLDSVADTLEDVRIYILLARDYMYKEYRDISRRSVAIILFGALYTISPIDLIPDSLGIIGLIDDAAVLKMVNKLLDGEIDKYKEWRKTTGKDAPKVED
ncbi:MAG: DUF1232 domain-containing protein [Clostridia bacterium]|nr:DUF1232 domain-containing protein [Clostridia bacterium]MBQ8926333.1 DUF1232 domain-containing protein [Clostridia bacterium]